MEALQAPGDPSTTVALIAAASQVLAPHGLHFISGGRVVAGRHNHTAIGARQAVAEVAWWAAWPTRLGR